MKYFSYLLTPLFLFSQIQDKEEVQVISKEQSSINLSEQVLENDYETLCGKLKNGMTYYIKKNAYPRDATNIRIIVKAGSLNETEEEQGIAHFTEHMVFRGTTNHKDRAIVDYIEEMGGKFGHHTNAFTSFDTTEYHVNLQNANTQNIHKGLDILHEMMFEATFDQDLLDKERGAVLNEKITVCDRLADEFESYFKFIGLDFLARRHPIGQEELIRTVTPEKMRAFYQRQYRPNKMAILISTSEDPKEVLKSVQSTFVKEMPMLLDAKKNIQPQALDEPKVLFKRDEVRSANVISFSKVLPLEKKNRFGMISIRKSILKEFCGQYVQKIMNDKATKNSLYFMPMLYIQPISNDYLLQGFQFAFFQNKELAGCKKFLEDLQNTLTESINEDSFAIFMKAKVDACEKELKNMHLIDHSSYINLFREDFLDNKGFVSFKAQNMALIAEAKKITIDEMQGYFLGVRETLHKANHVFVRSTEEVHFQEQELVDMIEEVRIQEQVSTGLAKPQQDLIIKLGAAKESKIDWKEHSLGYVDGRLQNGMRIIVHPNQEKKGVVEFKLRANGGANLIDTKDLPSHLITAKVSNESGLANLDHMSFENYLQKHDISLTPSVGGCCACAKPTMFRIDPFARALQGSAKSASLDELFKVLNAAFSCKQFSKESFNKAYQESIQHENSIKEHYDVKFLKWLCKILHKDVPLSQIHEASKADFNSAKKILEQSFLNPCEFTLIVSGDVSTSVVEEKVVKYLSALDNKAQAQVSKHNEVPTIESGEYTFYQPDLAFPFGQCMAMLKDKEYTYARAVNVAVLSNVLNKRLLDVVRMEQGQSYASMVAFVPASSDNRSLSFVYFFLGNKGKIPALHAAVDKMFDDLYTNGVEPQELDLAKKQLIAQKDLEEQNPARFIAFHEKRVFDHFPEENLVNYKSFIDQKCDLDAMKSLLAEINEANKAKFSRVQK